MSTAATNSLSSDASASPAARRREDGAFQRHRWPLWAAAAGALGAVGHLIAAPPPEVFDAQAAGEGAEVIGMLDRGVFHIGAVAGFLAVLSLLVFAAAWQRWSRQAGVDSAAASALPLALVASAGAMILGYGMMGALSIYLPGGINAGAVPPEGLYVLWSFLDLGPFMAWWGVAVAALLVSYVALVERHLPVWLGIVGVVGWLPPIGFVAVSGLPGFAGVVGPLWLAVTGVGLALSRLPAATPTR